MNLVAIVATFSLYSLISHIEIMILVEKTYFYILLSPTVSAL